MGRAAPSLSIYFFFPSAQNDPGRKQQRQGLTFHQDLYCVLPVLNPVHHFTAINPGVVGSQRLDFQGGVGGDGGVIGQGDHLPVLRVEPDFPTGGHEQDNFCPVGELAPLDPRGQQSTGVLLLRDVEEAGDVQGAAQGNAQGRLLRYLHFQAITTVCQFPNKAMVTEVMHFIQNIRRFCTSPMPVCCENYPHAQVSPFWSSLQEMLCRNGS